VYALYCTKLQLEAPLPTHIPRKVEVLHTFFSFLLLSLPSSLVLSVLSVSLREWENAPPAVSLVHSLCLRFASFFFFPDLCPPPPLSSGFFFSPLFLFSTAAVGVWVFVFLCVLAAYTRTNKALFFRRTHSSSYKRRTPFFLGFALFSARWCCDFTQRCLFA
jgi:hypothetical protein